MTSDSIRIHYRLSSPGDLSSMSSAGSTHPPSTTPCPWDQGPLSERTTGAVKWGKDPRAEDQQKLITVGNVRSVVGSLLVLLYVCRNFAEWEKDWKKMANSRSGKYLHSPHQLLVLSRILNNILCARIRIIIRYCQSQKSNLHHLR